MLRAEILDLEDQYYRLKSECESAGVLPGDFQFPVSQFPEDGAIIYEDPSAPTSAPVETNRAVPNRDGALEGDSILSIEMGTPVDDSQFDQSPLPADIGPTPIDVQQPPKNESPNSLPAPSGDAPNNDLSTVPNGGFSQLDSAPTIFAFEDDFDANQAVVTEIVLHDATSRGQDLDGEPGDEGLVLLVQPKSANGSIVDQTGELTVTVVDQHAQPGPREIGVWNFQPTELRAFFVKSGSRDRGILLHLPWGNRLPSSSIVTVSIRFVTNDGRKLETVKQIGITPPSRAYSATDPLIADWMSHDDRWSDDPGGQGSTATRAVPINADSTISRPRWRPVR